MKLMFASDMSFNYFPEFPGKAKAVSSMKAAAALMAQADFSVLNLENIFGDPTDGDAIVKSGPNLISSPAYMEYVRALKPTIVGLANNHTKDYGEVPMMNTMQMLRDEGFICIGAGSNLTEAYQPAILEKDGIRAAVIAVCENEFGSASDTDSGTAGYNLARVSHAIRDARRDGCKPIVYFHGGNEYNPFPSPGKTDLYRHFIEIGAEAVIAMHTHCPQGYEMYEGKPIVYSMGNFFFPLSKQSRLKVWNYGYMTELHITDDAVSMEVHPYTFNLDGITVFEGEEKAAFMKYLACLCAPIGDPAEIQAWFDSWCLTSSYSYIIGNYKQEMFADGNADAIKAIKNIFGCEAHNELVRNTMFMIYEGHVESAKARLPLIEKLQNLEII